MRIPPVRLDLSDVDALAERVIARIEVQGELGKEVAGILRQDAARQFQEGGDPRWAPLAKSTIAQKRSLGYPRLNREGIAPASSMQRGSFGPQNILMRTMALYSSWTNADDPSSFEAIADGEVLIGSNIRYAAVHQEGSKKRPGRPPARPIRVTEQARREIAALIERKAAGS